MNTSADLSLAAPSIPVPGRGTLRRLLTAAMARVQGSASTVLHAMRHRPARRAWRWSAGYLACALPAVARARRFREPAHACRPVADRLLQRVRVPPSLTFLLLTLGFDLVLLSLYARAVLGLATIARPLVTLGQATLYFFLVHWFMYAAMGSAFRTPGGLPATYIVWIIGLVSLYPICKAYEAFKHRMPAASVWRLI
jgi:peptidoglycan/LPS O-acetylase OafA/YrhL